VTRKLLIATVLVTVTGLTANAIYSRRGTALPEVTTAAVTRGSVISVVSASGTLEAVTTVQVGTQVSGAVQSLHADFNSIVKKGQVLARLDPSLFQTQVQQARANLVQAEADVERLRVALTDAGVKLARARELAAKQLIPATDVEAADVAQRSAEAQVRSASAQVTQARAALSQAEVNLQKTVIASPINGIVISRNVDVGQTVAASLQAPTLFMIAADLSEMQVKASIDESDLGQIHAGQAVSFRVDAYPDAEFHGTVTQVRLNPVVEQNVVTYAAIIAAPNADLRLRPGMTANVSVEVARRENVLRVPATALRFAPTDEVLAALGEEPPAAGSAPRNRTLWIYDGGLHPIRVTPGATDGTYTEIVAGSVAEGAIVATRAALPSSAATTTGTGSGNPLMGPTPPRRF
jgi:HlyD family secretion protein